VLTKLEEANMISQDTTAERSEKPRPAAKLRDEFDKRLSAYANCAVAAGVSLLAMSRSADAKIVYTPADIQIPTNSSVPIDLNHDGVADFSFASNSGVNGYPQFALEVSPARSRNGVWGKGHSSERFASNLPAGRKVGANKQYFQAAGTPALMASVLGRYYSSRTAGQWPYARGRYLGLRFVIAGEIHYGWARLSVPSLSLQGGILAVVTGYAHETVPNKPIITGKTKGPDVITLEPASLGNLARGASAMPAWRIKQTPAAASQ
jgi:hypothetical protein